MLDQDFDHHVVTAVIVSHDGARWLPKTLSALRGQTCPLQRVVAADTGSTDNSADILADHLPTEAIVALPANTGYGDAVRAALELPRSSTPVAGTDHEETTEWLWLIHDDFAPETDALAQLLRAADKDPRAAVLGPKLRDWFDRRLLVEVGVTIDGAGRRETGLEQREFDHGQHDGNRHVLAVSSAGMLIRRDVWDRLGGFDPSLPLFRDDIDFCWRVGGAGLRVLLVTDAVAHHAEASSRRRRPISATRNHPRRVDRRHAVFVLLANLPFGGMVTALLRNSVASWLRVLMYLLIKQPANALDEAAAIVLVYLRPDKLIRARFRRRRDRRRTYSAIRPFLARGIALRQFADAVTGILSGEPVRNTPGRHQAVTAPPGPEDEDEALADDTSFVRRVLLRPGVLLVLSLVVVTLVAERSLLFGDLLAGGALPPVAGNAGDLWSLYLASYPDSGIGSDSPVPTYVGFLALLSTITFGKPWLAVTLLLLGCVPLAGWTAHLLAREVLRYVPARLWLAATYALLPVATGAVAQGRLGTALVHALIPV
ncbi:MAG TPA: glycosyltransferase family 2 protein, partial [Candidatus Nocardiopsis merdipullorum]|nr:glycosyltransferase family 2 protein [Candidatus Nocardiopsis merdipullorum]